MSLAPFGRRGVTVTRAEAVGGYVVVAAADPDGPPPDPGQFYMLSTAQGWGGDAGGRPYVPRAFSVLRARDGELQFLLQDVGPGTRRLCALRPGDELLVLGPLGRGFAVDPGRRALLAGGGVGIAPLAILHDALGGDATALLGFRDAWLAEAAALVPGARVATDDGSVGHHGLVTELLRAELERDERAVVYACGPDPMLHAVKALCGELGVPAQLALESGMACGFGACFGCVVALAGGGYARICVDGPVLEAAALA